MSMTEQYPMTHRPSRAPLAVAVAAAAVIALVFGVVVGAAGGYLARTGEVHHAQADRDAAQAHRDACKAAAKASFTALYWALESATDLSNGDYDAELSDLGKIDSDEVNTKNAACGISSDDVSL